MDRTYFFSTLSLGQEQNDVINIRHVKVLFALSTLLVPLTDFQPIWLHRNTHDTMTIPDSAEKQKESRASERTTRLVEKKRKAELQDKLIQRAIFLSDTDLNNVYEYVDGVSSPRNNIEDYELEGEYGRRQINLRLRLVTVSAALNQFSLPAVAGRDGLIYGMTIRARVQREDDVDDAIAWKGPVQHQGISLPYDLALKLAHNFVQFRMWVRERAGMINAARKAAYEHISNLKADKKHLHLLEHIKDLQVGNPPTSFV